MEHPPRAVGPLRWRRASDPQRLEGLTRWSLYALITLCLLVALTTVAEIADGDVRSAWAYLVVSVVWVAVAIGTVRATIDAALGRRGTPWWWLLALSVAVTVQVVAVVWWFPAVSPTGGAVAALLLPLSIGFGVVVPLLSWRHLLPVSAGLAAGVAGIAAGDGADLAGVLSTGLLALVVFAFVGFSFRMSSWIVHVVWEQERAREVAARLAVAEERLRFSRDLHDIFGRTLSTVAVKSELAAELAARGRPEAATEMQQVRQIAEESLAQVRAVVAGYRAVDLRGEIAGARELLAAAGIAVEVAADGLVLPERVQQSLAWAVREGVTNVVRHSSARSCRIQVRTTDDDGVPMGELQIVNDGALRRHGGGSGLAGLAERLAGVGGGLDTSRSGETFRLRAWVPLEAAA